MQDHSDDFGVKPRNLRYKNRQLIIDQYRRHDVLTVSIISGMIGLSRTTVAKINQSLVDEGVIVEVGKGESTTDGGKRPLLYRFNGSLQLIPVFYIKYDVILFHLYDLAFTSIAVDAAPIATDSPLDVVAGVMREILERSVPELSSRQGVSLLACMVGVHANIDVNSGICIQSTHFPSWGRNTDMASVLREKLGIGCPIYIDSWIRLKTYGEKRLGIVGTQESIVLIDAGWHGVTSGILLNGQLLMGHRYLSGEIGHFMVNPEQTEVCVCGGSGCLEQEISCRTLLDRAAAAAELNRESLLYPRREELDLPVLFSAADAGDQLARDLLEDVIQYLAQGVSYVMLFLDPDKIYIEGDYAYGCRFLEQEILKRIEHFSLPRIDRREVVSFISSSSSDSILKGAAILAVDRYYETVNG